MNLLVPHPWVPHPEAFCFNSFNELNCTSEQFFRMTDYISVFYCCWYNWATVPSWDKNDSHFQVTEAGGGAILAFQMASSAWAASVWLQMCKTGLGTCFLPHSLFTLNIYGQIHATATNTVNCDSHPTWVQGPVNPAVSQNFKAGWSQLVCGTDNISSTDKN